MKTAALVIICDLLCLVALFAMGWILWLAL